MDILSIRWRVGRVRSSVGVMVENNDNDVVVTFDPKKVSKKQVFTLVRAQLIHFESDIMKGIVGRLPKE